MNEIYFDGKLTLSADSLRRIADKMDELYPNSDTVDLACTIEKFNDQKTLAVNFEKDK